ncbi:GLPGLI family protein [Robiginitalea sp. M366]|uniref:GLPGLI family protein n=1 Tax=Robiginitalea aestuariiviva TaxID=3036903 RepID=UPI00240D701E|nr:GLPGLI family protein [Robiginitalea aestuariiviva]MDG1572187.1 GLPGLI family protein [Robiginitalea aestuariiviva]
MKQLLILLGCSLVLQIGYCQVNNGEILYNLDMDNFYKRLVDQNKANPNKSIGFYDLAAKGMSSISMKLTFNKDIAIFNEIKTISLDGEEMAYGAASILANNGTYYTKLDSCYQLLERSVENRTLFTEIEKNDVVWNLTNESKFIGKFKVYKAYHIVSAPVGDIEVIAWYCPEIPLKLGPRDYVCQLPGLVLEFHGPIISYTAQKIKLNQTKEMELIWPNPKNIMSTEEYKKSGKDYLSKLPSRNN